MSDGRTFCTANLQLVLDSMDTLCFIDTCKHDLTSWITDKENWEWMAKARQTTVMDNSIRNKYTITYGGGKKEHRDHPIYQLHLQQGLSLQNMPLQPQ
uniref:Uncharacterized protein n=1 Tax=Arion vulgaris TaxID=1028688 RepID=A0A0B7ASQ6_9EUPU